jgi:RNA polymerase sigma-70 factor (ECF subfamily)
MEPAPLESGPATDPETVASSETLQTQLRAASLGDEAAFASVYDEVAPRVYGLVRRILRDVHQAEEVTQEVFLQVWETSSRFDPARGSALSWILTLAHRRAVDRVRSAEAERRRDLRDAERSVRTSFDQTAEAAHATIEATRVRDALATLSTSQRRAVELAYFGGHTHLEISRLLEIPLGTAKTRIRDGLIRLRDSLRPTADQPTRAVR